MQLDGWGKTLGSRAGIGGNVPAYLFKAGTPAQMEDTVKKLMIEGELDFDRLNDPMENLEAPIEKTEIRPHRAYFLCIDGRLRRRK